ncbi:LphB [Legionella wadsworthii]|uniref:LphB n=1 Tax=Legionella wadsworthii TaxID=28088 RepID=A0A378LSG6_9GAMM|nr:protein LphB [Legionella wadsworthii]STY28798.1 LphB [Legionella wadsworthii]
MKSGFRWYDSLLILLFFYLLVLQIQAIWSFTIDDMYISLRYARNWAAGEGIVWNLHAPRVEGYSNFSFVVLGLVTILLKGNPVLVLKWAGLLGLILTCYFLYLISRFWLPKRKSLLPCIALLFYKGQIIWATSGLETAVYESLICGSLYFCLRGMGYNLSPRSRGHSLNVYFVASGIFLTLAGMTRPEAPAIMMLFFILICWDRPIKESRHYWQGVAFFCFTLILFYGPYLIWRLAYFGFLFPNSVYCKGLFQSYSLSLDIHYLKLIWPLIILALPALWKAKDKRHNFLWVPSVIYLILLIDSDPVVAFYNRLFLPAFTLLLPLMTQGLYILLHSIRKKEDTLFALMFNISFYLILFIFIPAMSLKEYRYFSQNPIKGEELRGRVVDWLNLHASSKDWVVLADSGLIPYASPLNFIDSYCLNNLEMAHYPAKYRYELFCKNIFNLQPAFIILTSLVEKGWAVYTPSDVCLKQKIHKNNQYHLIKTFVTAPSDSSYHYEIYERSSIVPRQ